MPAARAASPPTDGHSACDSHPLLCGGVRYLCTTSTPLVLKDASLRSASGGGAQFAVRHPVSQGYPRKRLELSGMCDRLIASQAHLIDLDTRRTLC